LHIDLIDDPHFDITEGLEIDDLDSVETFVSRRMKKHPDPILLSDRLFLDAHKLHTKAKEGKLDRHTYERFINTANDILTQAQQCIKAPSTQTIKPSKTDTDQQIVTNFPQTAQHILKLFSVHLPLETYPWYVVSGTFLGLHRENGFLPHDYDIDLGINAHDVDVDALIRHLKDLPEHTIKSIYTIPRIQIRSETVQYTEEVGIVKLIHTSGIQIDLFIHHRRGDHLLHGSRIHMWSNSAYGLTRRTLAGIDVLAPDDPDRYLRENYGEWRIPKTAFNCSTDTPNLTITQNFYALAFFIRKLLLHACTSQSQHYYDTLRMLQDEKAIIDTTHLNRDFFSRPLT
jgi:hypothetical protein